MDSLIKELNDYLKNNNKNIKCKFGEIIIQNQIGQGGNAIVYSAKLGNHNIAIKFLINYDSKKIARFKAEYINIAINQDCLYNIVKPILYDELESSHNIPYIVMPLYPCNLKKFREELFKKLKTIPFDFVLNLIRDLIKSLISLNSLNIIHRDIKPENILFDVEKEIFLLTDFGIAHFSNENPINNLTDKKEKLGNFQFASPEQRNNKEITCATDVYSMFMVIYWFVFGEVCSGSDRDSLFNIYKNSDSKILDLLLEKSLSSFPQNRASISYIIKELQNLQSKINYESNTLQRITNYYENMRKLADSVLSVIPESWAKFYNCSDNTQIDIIIRNLNNLNTNEHLCFNTGFSNDNIYLIKRLGNGNYLINSYELIITSLWLYFDEKKYNDIILITVESPKPYNFDNKEYYSYAIIDNKIITDYSTIDSGFIRIDGKVKKTDDLNIEFRKIWDINDGKYIAISFSKQCSAIPNNDVYLKNLQSKSCLTKEILEEYRNLIRKNKDREIELTL